MGSRRRRSRRKPPSRSLWAAAILLALAGPTAYLVWDTTLLWWLAPLTALPVYFLIDKHGWRRGDRDESRHFNTGDAGPWTPPDGV